ncbi:putative uncharacterized protein [Waddlia chondrophila 2032/99]|uniref:Uncharacterized protein n=2 Tax=Waddlia chondrophila TaxID=71667 RepID=D6YU43_WADCW|nr:hypothetical protein [Waddlia chondrophila]ADI37654.1 hypothetical protein wcw_0279 [Waddlia chondrophila WSU 86-1044]CCB90599.1 putative uncharacterized protein [Waddlia chondrophila 2032/99]
MKLTFFQCFTIAVFCLFIGVIVFVAIVSFSRESKASLLSMAKINKVRFEETAVR